eukprot:4552810-Alexandrium_andersonii.AAC.1
MLAFALPFFRVGADPCFSGTMVPAMKAEPEDGGEGEASPGEARACCKDVAAVRQALAPYVRSSAEA